MYKLVAIDLDGTLLNSYGEVSEKNKEAIQKAKNKGAEIVMHLDDQFHLQEAMHMKLEQIII